nr:hypothetical protein OH837_48885 [Streptomyces canus]
MTNHTPPTEQQLNELQAIAARAADDPFYVSDCEGSLQVWRESALTHVQRDEHGEISMYSFPSSYRTTDQIIEIDLDSWDPGEDASDDQRRQDITDLVDSRAAMGAMVDEVKRLRAQMAAVRGLCDEQDKAARVFEVSTPAWIRAVRAVVESADADEMAAALRGEGFGADQVATMLSADVAPAKEA